MLRRGFFALPSSLSGLLRRKPSFNFSERRVLPFTPEQFFAVVLDIDSYDEFVPFCEAARVTDRLGEGRLRADMEIGFRVFTERYTSLVTYERPRSVEVTSTASTLFRHLRSRWAIAPVAGDESGCEVCFDIDFEPASVVHAGAVAAVFSNLTQHQIQAFEDRCTHLYGSQQSLRSGDGGGGRTDPSSSRASTAVERDGGDDEQRPQTAPVETTQPPREEEEEAAAASAALEESEAVAGFTAAERDRLRLLFNQQASEEGQLDLSGFCRVCESVRQPNVVFQRFRDRSVAKAVANDRSLAEHVFEARVAPPGEATVDFLSFLDAFYALTRASLHERFMRVWRLLPAPERTRARLRAEAEAFFDVELEVVRYVVPEMVYRRADDLEREFPHLGEDPAAKDTVALALLGLLQPVVEQTEEGVREALSSIIVAGEESSMMSERDWEELWNTQRGVFEMATVVSVANLIHWAAALNFGRKTNTLL